MRKRLIIAVTFLGGVYFIVEFLLPAHFPAGFGFDGAWRGIKIGEYHEEILLGLQCVSAGAIGLGLINIFRVFGITVLKRRKGWQFALTLVLAMFTMMAVMFTDWGKSLANQDRIGPLGVQRDFQNNILNRIGKPAPNPAAAAQNRTRTDGALYRYLNDTRKAIAPPDIGLDDAAGELSALSDFLLGKAPAPIFFRLTDAQANPPVFKEKSDLLRPPGVAQAPSPVSPQPGAAGPQLLLEAEEPLRSDGAAARLAELAKRRDELVGRLTAAAQTITKIAPKPGELPNSKEIPPTLTAAAQTARSAAPEYRALAADIRKLADAERATYKEPPEVTQLFRGGPKAPPPPPYGRFYLAARALAHTGDVLEKYALVLERAAVAIPNAQKDEQKLADWIDARVKENAAVRDDWRARERQDLERAVPAVDAALNARQEKEDAALREKTGQEPVVAPREPRDPRVFRARMLSELRNCPDLAAAFDQSIQALASAEAALKDAKVLADGLQAAGKEIARAQAELGKQEAPLRLHLIRKVEEDLRNLGLEAEDEAVLVPASLSLLAVQPPDADQAKKALQEISAAAKARIDDLTAKRGEIEKTLTTEVWELRKTWPEKPAAELSQLRVGEDAKISEMKTLKVRVEVITDAKKVVDAALEKIAPSPGAKALSELLEALPKAQTLEAAQEAVEMEKALRTLEDQRLALVEDAGRTLERLAFKEDLKEMKPLMAALAGAKALAGADGSATMLRRAAQDARQAAEAQTKNDGQKARALMSQTATELAAAREGLQDALNAASDRSTVKGLYKVLFNGLYVSLGAAMFSLLAFYIASAAYRAFRLKSAEAVLMMVAALIVMLGQIPFGSYLWKDFPAFRLWVMQVFSTPAFRAIALGAAVASLAMAMRMWLSLETSAFYREEESAAEEGK